MSSVPALPPRPRDSHKGTYGRVLVLAGSRGMSGAAILCASGALRGGAGLVFLAVPEAIQPIVATANPCYLTVGLPTDESGTVTDLREVQKQLRAASSVVAGPGWGQTPSIPLFNALLHDRAGPLVLDADALNLLSHFPSVLVQPKPPVVITPHPGEFARLIKSDIPSVQADREGQAVRFAREHGVIVVLKGAGTVVTDGQRVYVNPTGNPGMATGGTGDVLTGLLGALLARGQDPFVAAQQGVYLHGLAGDLGAEELGEESLTASDLLDYLPGAFRQLSAGGGAG